MPSRRPSPGKSAVGGKRRDAVIPHVRKLCKDYFTRVRWMHQRPALTADGRWRTAVEGNGALGWLDLTLWGPGGFILRECKGDDGYPSADQRLRMKELREAGIDVDVWRPRDVHSGRVAREVAALNRPRRDA